MIEQNIIDKNALLTREIVVNELNLENIALIATYLQGGASEIKGIFDLQVGQMRSIHTDIKSTRNVIDGVKQENSSIQDFD
jgi:hypothetical protein